MPRTFGISSASGGERGGVKQETEQRLETDGDEIRQNAERGKAEVGEGTGAEVRECGRSRWRHGGQ